MAETSDISEASPKKSSADVLKKAKGAWDDFGDWLKGGGVAGAGARSVGAGYGAMKRSFLDLFGHWRPSRPQQLVLAGILVIAFLDLKVASKFGDIWSMAFVGGDKEQGTPPPPEPGGSKKEPPIPPESAMVSQMIPPL